MDADIKKLFDNANKLIVNKYPMASYIKTRALLENANALLEYLKRKHSEILFKIKTTGLSIELCDDESEPHIAGDDTGVPPNTPVEQATKIPYKNERVALQSILDTFVVKLAENKESLQTLQSSIEDRRKKSRKYESDYKSLLHFFCSDLSRKRFNVVLNLKHEWPISTYERFVDFINIFLSAVHFLYICENQNIEPNYKFPEAKQKFMDLLNTEAISHSRKMAVDV